jgi:hypothetical protein
VQHTPDERFAIVRIGFTPNRFQLGGREGRETHVRNNNNHKTAKRTSLKRSKINIPSSGTPDKYALIAVCVQKLGLLTNNHP